MPLILFLVIDFNKKTIQKRLKKNTLIELSIDLSSETHLHRDVCNRCDAQLVEISHKLNCFQWQVLTGSAAQ